MKVHQTVLFGPSTFVKLWFCSLNCTFLDPTIQIAQSDELLFCMVSEFPKISSIIKIYFNQVKMAGKRCSIMLTSSHHIVALDYVYL